MNTITKGDFLTMVKLQHLEVLTQAQLSQNTKVINNYMQKALTTELSANEIADSNAMISDVAGLQQWCVLRDDFSKAIVYTRREQIAWDEPQRGEFGEILKARGGVYKPTGENKKLGRVGQKYGESKQTAPDKHDVEMATRFIEHQLNKNGLNKEDYDITTDGKLIALQNKKTKDVTHFTHESISVKKIEDWAKTKKESHISKEEKEDTKGLREHSKKIGEKIEENKKKVKSADLDPSKRDYLFQVVNYSKKPNLDDIDGTEVKGEHAEQINKILDKLPEVDFKNDFTSEDLPENLKGGVFIAKHKGKRYLVDTQGYDYVRYATQLVTKKSYTDMSDI